MEYGHEPTPTSPPITARLAQAGLAVIGGTIKDKTRKGFVHLEEAEEWNCAHEVASKHGQSYFSCKKLPNIADIQPIVASLIEVRY